MGWGWVELIVNGVAPPLTDAFAGFYLGPAGGDPASCTTLMDGQCVMTICPRATNEGVACNEPTTSAGDLTFSGGPIALTVTDATYAGQQDVVWSGGETLVATAGGASDGVPAFNQTVIAPSPFTGVSPNLGTLTMVDRSVSFQVSWMGAEHGDIVLTLTHDVPPEPTYQVITCTVPGTDGAVTISSTMLAQFGSGPGEVSITNSGTNSFNAGGFVLTFDAVWASGPDPTAGSFTFL